MSKDEKWMREALAMAEEAKANGELPFGAVVVRSGEIISRGRCREKTLSTVLAHAEAEAVDGACKKLGLKLTDCVIYCTNEPCAMCAAAIFQAKVPRVVIGASRTDMTFLRPRKLGVDDLASDSGYEIEITRGTLRQEVLKLFTGIK